MYEKLELRAMTKSQRMRESAVMITATNGGNAGVFGGIAAAYLICAHTPGTAF